jgi:hypothetical protein
MTLEKLIFNTMQMIRRVYMKQVIREFWPVGQGGFYSEQINTGHSIFNMVYDCGSVQVSQADRMAIEYTDRLKNNNQRINLLCISHFDDDHVSAISTLKKNIKIDRVLLSATYRVDIVYSVILYLMFSDESKINSSYIDLLIEIYRNAGGYFEGAEIITVEASEGENTPNDIGSNDNDNLDLGQDIVPGSTTPKILKKGSSIYISSPKFTWYWMPFNYKHSSITINVIKAIGIYLHGQGRREDDYDWLLENLAIIGIAKKISKEIKDVYKAVIGTPLKTIKGDKSAVNKGSMTILSTSENKAQGFICELINRHSYCRFRCYRSAVKLAFLYTGDYNALDTATSDALFTYYKNFLKQIGGVQVPHHGSDYNYSSKLTDYAYFSVFSVSKVTKQFPGVVSYKDAASKGYAFLVMDDDNTKLEQYISFY